MLSSFEETVIELKQTDAMLRQEHSLNANLQIAVKNNQQSVLYFEDQIPLPVILDKLPNLKDTEFQQKWDAYGSEARCSFNYMSISQSDIEGCNVSIVSSEQHEDGHLLKACTLLTLGSKAYMILIMLTVSNRKVEMLTARSEEPKISHEIVGLFEKYLSGLH